MNRAFTFLVHGEALKKKLLKSGQLHMLPISSLVYYTSNVSLRVMWKALYFICDISPFSPMWVLKLLRCFTGSFLLSYLGILGSVKWFNSGAFLISRENDKLSSSSSRSQDLCSLSELPPSLLRTSTGGWDYSTRCLACSTLLSSLFLGKGLVLPQQVRYALPTKAPHFAYLYA